MWACLLGMYSTLYVEYMKGNHCWCIEKISFNLAELRDFCTILGEFLPKMAEIEAVFWVKMMKAHRFFF